MCHSTQVKGVHLLVPHCKGEVPRVATIKGFMMGAPGTAGPPAAEVELDITGNASEGLSNSTSLSTSEGVSAPVTAACNSTPGSE